MRIQVKKETNEEGPLEVIRRNETKGRVRSRVDEVKEK